MANYSSGGDPRLNSPTVDERNEAALIEQMRRLAPYYTPEWRFRPDDPDPGTALFLMFSRLLDGNIRRLNQMPFKSFLAFLNRFDVPLLQARPALAQVTFQLSEGTPEPVLIPQGTQLSAAMPGEAEPVLFETARTLLVTTAKLTEQLSVSPKRDRIVRLAGGGMEIARGEDGRGVALFGTEGVNIQEHAFYLRHDFLFLLKSPATIEIAVKNTRNEYAVPETVRWLADREAVVWEYYSDGSWLLFDRVLGGGERIRLTKRRRLPITQAELFDTTGYWIRCRARSLDEGNGTPQLGSVQLDTFSIKSDFASVRPEDGIVPDRLYFNDIQVDESGCQPFGEFFAQYGLFYLSSREAFSKRGANVSLQFRLSFILHRLLPDKPPQINWKPIMKRHEVDKTEIPDPVTIASVQWEYWNGSAWVKLQAGLEAQRLFIRPWEGTETREIQFVCPEDISEIAVNSEENFWIRGRILSVENAYSPNAVYYSPYIEKLRARFSYTEPMYPPERMLIQNNLDLRERTREVQTGGVSFRPFAKLEGRHPSVWFGFDQPPERGPIAMYISLLTKRTTEGDVPHIEWEYLKKNGSSASWAPLAAADETRGFTQSGTVQFVGPQDFAHVNQFGSTRYWIRAVNRDGRFDEENGTEEAPRALGLQMNTVLAVQQETLLSELPQRVESYDTAEERTREHFMLSRRPVLEEEVWVDETGALSEEEALRLEAMGIGVDIIRDSENGMLRSWVRYAPADHFLLSGPEDRFYKIDRATGQITFGNGQYGKQPPNSGEDTVRVTYTTGGGRRGNVPGGTITTLQSSIAFIDSVTNAEPAAGGCDPGTLEEAIVRGPKLFTHRNRAVTAEDYEWLTREAHPNVAKVKCLPNTNVKLEREPGAISIVVLPKSGVGAGAHFQELKKQVERELLKRSASTVAFPGSIQVMDPAVLEIGVGATLLVKGMDDVVSVEREAIRKLNAFLDPLTGNSDGKGWDIGQIVHRSMFFALLKSVGPVQHIPQLSLSVMKVENGERIEWHPDRLDDIPHGIVTAGAHRVIVEVGKARG